VTGPDIGASIRARLLNKAKAEGQDFNRVLTRYALERLLYRLGSFGRRATPLPDGVPFGLTEDFAQDRQKQTQWRAFLAKNALAPVLLAEVLDLLRRFLMPPLGAVVPGAAQVGRWWPGDGWR
jgi:hypothetical protein